MIDKRGRVVKQRRDPVRSVPKMGASGIALIEYLGHSDSLQEFVAQGVDSAIKSYMFSSRPAHRTQFVDKTHADHLLTLTDETGTALFRVLAQYATAAHKKRYTLNIPSEAAPPDDLPSGFAPRERSIDCLA